MRLEETRMRNKFDATQWALSVVMVMLIFGGAVLGSVALPQSARAVAIDNSDFRGVWARTDKPVADGAVGRTWMWGPEAITAPFAEAYVQGPNHQRTVQYYDKSRMEITNPTGDPSSVWYVTNGLLVVEMMSGQMQVGDSSFTPRAPAEIGVAGDVDDPNAPTYATLAGVRDARPKGFDALISERI